MSNKKAFVFDTNFIFKNKNLKQVKEKLESNFSVYVTQVSIDERIGQKCAKLKQTFSDIESKKNKYKDFVDIKFKTTYEDYSSACARKMQSSYEKLFDKNIIPFNRDAETFSKVLDRANKKDPPFIENASDKGLKDALIWLSLLDFFSNNGEEEIVFVTDDNGFIKNSQKLCEEFCQVTKKSIEFKPNQYYNDLCLAEKEESDKQPERKIIPDISQLRSKISSVIGDICMTKYEDGWGGYEIERTFIISEKLNENDLEKFFNELDNIIAIHIFDSYIPADQVLLFGDIVENGSISISIESLENANNLFKEIKGSYPDYLKNFYYAASNIFNRNYEEPSSLVSYDELPF